MFAKPTLRFALLCTVLLLTLAAMTGCGPTPTPTPTQVPPTPTATPQPSLLPGDPLAVYDFSAPRTFEEGVYGEASLVIQDGVYRIGLRDGSSTVWWGQWGDALDDVIVEVSITQRSAQTDVQYGVMCRVQGIVGGVRTAGKALPIVQQDATPDMTATPDATAAATPDVTATPDATAAATPDATALATADADSATPDAAATPDATAAPADGLPRGDGYLFLIRGDGYYGIFQTEGGNVAPLLDWTASDAVATGANATNVVRAACVGDALQLSVNGTLLATVRDRQYAQGQVGLAAAAGVPGVVVEFDDLTVFAVAP